jgi:hypothetical protein
MNDGRESGNLSVMDGPESANIRLGPDFTAGVLKVGGNQLGSERAARQKELSVIKLLS